MLRLMIPEREYWDERKEEFVSVKAQTIQLEHSLVSISKWESKWQKSFLSTDEKTYEETIDYIKCMTITPNVNPLVYDCLTPTMVEQIRLYINSPMTATTFSDRNLNKGGRGQIVTAELIYGWMVSLRIPFECQKWHINRLLTLIRVCGLLNKPPEKMSKRDVLKNYARLNAERRKKLGTSG